METTIGRLLHGVHDRLVSFAHTVAPASVLYFLMAPVPKAKAAGVSASSFLDLKAELAKKEGEFALKKAAGKSTEGLIGGVKRPDKVRTPYNPFHN